MKLLVREFCDAVKRNLNGLVKSLESQTSRSMSDKEKAELADSYKEVAKMFSIAIKSNPIVEDMNILIEHKLPSASAWCDMILLGDDVKNNHQVVIVELKNWRQASKDAPGAYPGSINHNGNDVLHPSEQLKGYKDYCRSFHSAVNKGDEVYGFVYFTQKIDLKPYSVYPNDQLAKECPMFNTEDKSTDELAKRIAGIFAKPNPKFADDFVNGYYRQDRNILKQVSQNLRKMNACLIGSMISPFVLLNEQRKAYNQVMAELIKVKNGKKHVFIVSGNPGSGKSAIAANLWVDSAMKFGNNGNVVFVTTSDSQNDNWTSMFRKSGVGGSQHMILKASSFKPSLYGIDDEWLKNEMLKKDSRYISPTGTLDRRYYKDYIEYLQKSGYGKNYAPNKHFLSIVDEAHALVYPEKMEGMAMGWKNWAGPMAYNIIYCSQISVFFMDDKQGFRDRESTSISDIKDFCKMQGVECTEIGINMQFRCSGSQDYIDWVEALCSTKQISNHSKWQSQYELELVDYPSDVDDWLRNKNTDSIRLLSSYSRQWASHDKGSTILDSVHSSKAKYDFVLDDKNGMKYEKYWNYGDDYTAFVQGVKGTMMNVDPLSEVGCPYIVRGFDYKYIGILWLEDLIWRNGHWIVDLNYNFETGTKSVRSAAFKEMVGYWRKRYVKKENMPMFTIPGLSACDKLCETVFQAYRIILTRGICGTVLYIKDEETRNYVKSLL